MDFLINVQTNIVLSILLIVLLSHAYLNMNTKMKSNRLYIYMMGLTCLALILETFSVLLNNPNLKQFMILHMLANVIGFIVTPCIPYVGCLFISEWINQYRQEKTKVSKLLLLPLIINTILTLMSLNGSGFFYITIQNTYVRGPLFFVFPCISYFYFGYNLYLIYKIRKRLAQSERVLFILFYIVPAVFTVIQLEYSNYLIIWNSAAIILVVTYIFMLNNQAYRDTLTGLGNRLLYEYYTQNLNYKHFNKLFLVYIDIDDFKTINDQYGHFEGDEAIRTFANLLIESYPHKQNKKIIRIGGDEFLLFIEEQYQEKAEDYVKSLIQYVNAFNDSGVKPYELKFSYGLVSYTSAYENVCELMEYADQLMYEQKNRRKYMQ